MKAKKTMVPAALWALILSLTAGAAPVGSLDAPAPPTSGSSAMYTLLDLYNRLVNGTAVVKRTGAFTEPTGGPTSGTMKTLDEIMAKAPAVDDTNGVGKVDVPTGKTFWGLTSGAWGRQVGLAAPARVPLTGQTTSYVAGDDGSFKVGTAYPIPRFTDFQNGTVADNLTGLVWLKNANVPNAARDWAAALGDVASLNSIGQMNGNDAGDTSNGGSHQTDWRLPNCRELFSLADARYSAPALCNAAGTAKWASGDPFTGVQTADGYWSSTTSADDPNRAWAMGISNGSVAPQAKTSSSGVFVWPVRGGLTWQAGSLYASDPVVGSLRYAPAGTFTQGSSGEVGRSINERQFSHELTKNLAVMETEVTQWMWDTLLALDPGFTPTNPSFWIGSSLPVERATWYEAVLFANRLSVIRGLTPCYYADAGFTTPITSSNYTVGPFHCDWDVTGYRLPSEGEWEYFCRAGTTTPFSVSEPNYDSSTHDSCIFSLNLNGLDSVAWWCGNSGSQTYEAGGKWANPWNLKDVHGNVFEWCWDWYKEIYPLTSATDYRGADTGTYRVLRGGSWYDFAQNCRSAFRYDAPPYFRYKNIGFRLVRSLP